VVELLTDNYPGETSWEVLIDGDVVLSGGPYSEAGALIQDTLCFAGSDEPCIQFEIFDSYGDGICCGYGQGYYSVSLDGQVMASGENSETPAARCLPAPRAKPATMPFP